MTSNRPGMALVPPPTLEKRLEALQAARALLAPGDEAVRPRREEIAALRREASELVLRFEELQRSYSALVEERRRDPRLRSRVTKHDADQPRVPAGEHGGGQWTSGGDGAAQADTGVAPAATAPPASQHGPHYAQADPGTRTDATGGGGNVATAAAQQFEQNTVRDLRTWKETRNREYDRIWSGQIPADSPKRPEQLVDSSGQPILDDKDSPIVRPADLPPETYVQAGLISKSHNLAESIHNVLQALQGDPSGSLNTSVTAALIGTVRELLPFTHGGFLDAERFDSNYVRDYRHYTSIALGIFMAAAGVSREDMLAIADTYAASSSTFGAHEKMDEHYKHLSEQDVKDNLKGYELYESGRIRLKN